MAIVWCTQADITNAFDLNLASTKTDGVTRVWPDNVIAAAINQASSITNSYLNRYVMPASLATIPGDLLDSAVCLAVWHLVRYRGFNPDRAEDNMFKEERDRAIARLDALSKNAYHPVLSFMSDPAIVSGNSGVTTSSMVGAGGVEYEYLSSDGRGMP